MHNAHTGIHNGAYEEEMYHINSETAQRRIGKYTFNLLSVYHGAFAYQEN